MSSSLLQSETENSRNGQKVEKREERQARRGRTQISDAEQKHVTQQPQKALTPSYYIQNIYVYISTSHIYKSVWIVICLIVGSYG